MNDELLNALIQKFIGFFAHQEAQLVRVRDRERIMSENKELGVGEGWLPLNSSPP